MITRWRGLRLVFDLYCFDGLVALGWRMPLRTFQLLVGWLGIVAAPLILATSLLLSRALAHALTVAAADTTGAQEVPAATGASALLLMVLLNLYVGGVQVAREAMSRRRYKISHSPNRDFYRGLDISMSDVFLVYVALRMALVAGAIMLANVGFVIVFGAVGPPPPLLWSVAILMPLSAATLSAAVAARFAERGSHDRHPSAGPIIVVALLAGVAGYLLTLLAGAMVAASSAPTWIRDLDVTALTGAVAAASLVLAVASLATLIRRLRRMTADSFVIRPVSTGGTTPRGRLAEALRHLLWRISPVGAALHQELRGHHSATLIRRMLGVTVVGLCFVIGAAWSYGGEPMVDGMVDLPIRVMAVIAFVACLVLTEITMFAIGPATLSRHLRYAWEAGLALRVIVVSAVGYYILPALSFGLLLSAGTTLAFGKWPVALVPIGVSVTCADVIGQSLTTTPKETVDGSVETNLFVGLVTVMLSAPVLMLALSNSIVASAMSVGYMMLLVGGAIACLARRLLALPSTSAT